MEENEKQLFKQLGNDDPAAFHLLYEFLETKLSLTLRYYLPDEESLADILQDIYYLLWDQRHQIAAMEFPMAYLKRCARNKAADYTLLLKRRNNFIMKLRDRQFGEALDPDYDIKERDRLIEQAVGTLSPQRKKVYLLCREENKKYKEVAQMLGLSENTVRNTLDDAVERIGRFLKQKLTPLLILSGFIIIQ